jgi:membrane protein implicated in regulation of membrane protease activity
MRWFFLIPLATGLLTSYISLISADEIAYLTGAITVLSFLITLVIAPWQIQLLVLILAIVAVRQFWRKLDSEVQLESPQNISSENLSKIEEKVSRKYRGVAYDLSVSEEGNLEGNESANTQYELKYRGASVEKPLSEKMED